MKMFFITIIVTRIIMEEVEELRMVLVGWWGAVSDREMSQCYELLIATHPIHILMPNPCPPIGPSNPQHRERGKMRTLPKPPFLSSKYKIQVPFPFSEI